jgi:hypothetical protein
MRKTALILVIIIVTAVLFPLTASAYPLDEILDYTITVDVRKDGTLDMKYHIQWKVLDSTTEGPLEWVRIGIPNKHVDEIKALSDNIKEIKYSDDNGDYIRIDFKEKYAANAVLDIDFSIHQSYMYTIDSGTSSVKYNFTPGWFEQIQVDSIRILWNNENVDSSDCESIEGDYLVWSGSLKADERKTVNVSYKTSVLNVNTGMQYYESDTKLKEDIKDTIIAIVITFLVIGILAFRIVKMSQSHYMGGFGRRRFGRSCFFSPHGGFGGGHCVCVSSCACACACAGGGRAGCSAKNFYGASVDTEKLKKAVNG